MWVTVRREEQGAKTWAPHRGILREVKEPVKKAGRLREWRALWKVGLHLERSGEGAYGRMRKGAQTTYLQMPPFLTRGDDT